MMVGHGHTTYRSCHLQAARAPLTSAAHSSNRPRTGAQDHRYHEDLLRYIEMQRQRHNVLKKPALPATHPRACCPLHPFTAQHGVEKFCAGCECFVCEVAWERWPVAAPQTGLARSHAVTHAWRRPRQVPAHQCPYWVSFGHCRADYRDRSWQIARDRARHSLPPVQSQHRPDSIVPRRKVHS